jgi:hypothetical protein
VLYCSSSLRCSSVGDGQVVGTLQRTSPCACAGDPLGRGHCRRGVSVEVAVGAQADRNCHGNLTQPLGSLRRVVTRSQDEERRHPVSGQVVDQALHWRDRDGMGVLTWMHPSHIERGNPAIPRQAALGQPLGRLPGHDRLPSGVAGGIRSRRSTGRERARLSHAGPAATPETHQITIPMISG